MKREITSMKKQGILFAENFIDDRLPSDSQVYAFDALIDTFDLSSILNSYSEEGGKLYSPRDMLSILLYAYSIGITSSYKIAREVATNLEFIYLAGGHQISRRALCEFRRRNVIHLGDFFSEIVQTAMEIGLIDLSLFSLDGSKFAADASKSKTKTKKEWDARRVKIRKNVEGFLNELEENDSAEENIENDNQKRFDQAMKEIEGLRKNTDLSKTECRKLNRIENLVKEDSKINEMFESNPDLRDDENINLTDNDSRIMKNGNGIYLQGYNCQIVTSNQFIVAASLVQDENDQAQLIPMIDKLEEEIPENTEYKFLADAGYNKGDNLKELENRKNIDPYISMNNRKEDTKTDLEKTNSKYNFEHDEGNDKYICPAGVDLELFSTKKSKKQNIKVYRADHKKCQVCETRYHCLITKSDLKAGARIIEDDGSLYLRKGMKEKMELQQSKEIYADRAVEPEPVFGQLKHNLGMRQLRVEGFMYLKGEFLLMCLALNISKLIRFNNKIKKATDKA